MLISKSQKLGNNYNMETIQKCTDEPTTLKSAFITVSSPTTQPVKENIWNISCFFDQIVCGITWTYKVHKLKLYNSIRFSAPEVITIKNVFTAPCPPKAIKSR